MTTTTLAERVQMALSRDKTLTQAGLARACGIHRASVNAWVKGGTDSIDGKYLTSAAMYLRVEAHWLATGEGAMEPTGILARLQSDLPVDGWTRTTEHQNLIRNPVTLLTVGRIPLLNQGNTKLLDSYMDGTADHQPPSFTYHSDNTTGLFAYTVPDDLMEPRIPQGCTAIINMNAEPQHGRFVLVQDGERSYIRRLVIDGDLQYLETISGRLPAKPLTGSILGSVKEVVISMD